jgi:transposase InsO family protein
MLNVVDEFTRECLTIEAARSFTGKNVVETLKELFAIRGYPKFIRSDNGPEFACQAVKNYLKDSGVGSLFIEPDSPWENGYIESFNGKLRDECLDGDFFYVWPKRSILWIVGEWTIITTGRTVCWIGCRLRRSRRRVFLRNTQRKA